MILVDLFRNWITSVGRMQLKIIIEGKRIKDAENPFWEVEDEHGDKVILEPVYGSYREDNLGDLIKEENRKEIDKAIEKLPSKNKNILELVYFQGMSFTRKLPIY